MDEQQQRWTREVLADYAHEAWSDWMKYLFDRSLQGPNGTVIIPAWAVERWTRQMNTSYADLPESEKESDRNEADAMLFIVAHSRKRVPQPPTEAGADDTERERKDGD